MVSLGLYSCTEEAAECCLATGCVCVQPSWAQAKMQGLVAVPMSTALAGAVPVPLSEEQLREAVLLETLARLLREKMGPMASHLIIDHDRSLLSFCR